MLCPVCGKELSSEVSGEERIWYCPFCSCRLPVRDESFRALVTYLINDGVIREEGDLLKCAEVEFRYVTDDGLVPMKQFDEKFRFPLYYTQNDILRYLYNTKRIYYSLRFHRITEFYSWSLTAVKRGGENGDARSEIPDGYVLAEVLPLVKDNLLTLVYARREELISRAGPMQCLYGCPVSSEIEKKYESTVQYVEEL